MVFEVVALGKSAEFDGSGVEEAAADAFAGMAAELAAAARALCLSLCCFFFEIAGMNGCC